MLGQAAGAEASQGAAAAPRQLSGSPNNHEFAYSRHIHPEDGGDSIFSTM